MPLRLLCLLCICCLFESVRAEDTHMEARITANKALVKRFYEAVASQAPKDLSNFFASNYQVVDLGALRDTRGSKFAQTNPPINERIADLRGAFPDFTVEVVQMVGEGDSVFAESILRGHQEGIFLGLEPTGKEIVIRSFTIFTINEGEISQVIELANLLSIMQQMGYVVLAE